jgi:hypothetical protein
MSTTDALIDVTAESGGATARDREQHIDMGPADPRSIALDEGTSCSANEIGHLKGWPTHYPSGSDLPFNTSASRGLAVACK